MLQKLAIIIDSRTAVGNYHFHFKGEDTTKTAEHTTM